MNPRKILAFGVGPICAAALGFFTLPMVTWFFSQEDVGRMSMLTVAISLSTLLFTLGLDQAYVREFHESKNKSALLKVVVLPGGILLCIVLASLLSYRNIISTSLFDIDSFTLSLLVAIAVLSDFLSRFFSLILRMHEKGLAFSLSQLLPKLLLLLIIAAYAFFGAKKVFENLVLATVTSMFFACVVFGWNTRKDWAEGLTTELDYDYLKKLLRFGLPLILGGLAFWGLSAVDRVFLKELSTFEQLGLYSVSVSFAAAATIFQAIFTTVWSPVVYKWAATGEGLENINKVIRFVLFAVVVLFSLTALFSWVTAYILPANYEQVKWILIPCLGGPLLYTLSETTVVGLGITRRSDLSMLAAVIAFLVNILGNWLLVPTYGAKGAAISTVIAFWFFFFFRTEFAIHAWRPIARWGLYSYTIVLVTVSSLSCLYGDTHRWELMALWGIILLSGLITFKFELKIIANYLILSKNKKEFAE